MKPLDALLLAFWLRVRREEKGWNPSWDIEHTAIEKRIRELGGSLSPMFPTISKPKKRKPQPDYPEWKGDSRGDVGTINGRPKVNYGQVICAVCNKPCNFEESAVHVGLSGQGMVLIRATCHGEYCDIAVPFSELRNKRNPVVTVFGVAPVIEKPKSKRLIGK